MSPSPRLFVIVPALDEIENLPRLVASFRKLAADLSDLAPSFVMVDDGSTDGTGAEALRLTDGLDFELLTHATNQGPGRAFATAFAHLADRLAPYDWVVTIEGDNTSRTELLRQMITRAAEGFDVVLASPYLYGGGVANTSPYRTVLSHLANGFVKESLGLHGIVTMSSFFRLYRGKILLHLQRCYGKGIIERSGFESMIELLLKLVFVEATISEVAMSLDGSLRAGKSKMPTLRTSLHYLTLWNDKQRWRNLARAQDATQDLAAGASSP